MSELRVSFIISESIDRERNLSGGESTIIINPINVILTKYIPTQLSFGLTVIISNFEHNIPAKFEIKVIHKETGFLSYSTGENQLPPLDDVIKNFNFNIDLKNIDIVNTGIYEVVFIYNGSEHEYEFEVIKGGH